MSTPRFQESQRFSQPWLHCLLGAMVGLMAFAFVEQIVQDRPWGSQPAPDWLIWILTVLICIVMPLSFLWIRLETRVEEMAVRIRLRPFRWRTIQLDQIETCAVRRYRPVREYGGWGIRYGFRHGWAYNIRGNQGVQLTLSGAKPVLIGSQRPETLALAINQARPRSGPMEENAPPGAIG